MRRAAQPRWPAGWWSALAMAAAVAAAVSFPGVDQLLRQRIPDPGRGGLDVRAALPGGVPVAAAGQVRAVDGDVVVGVQGAAQ